MADVDGTDVGCGVSEALLVGANYGEETGVTVSVPLDAAAGELAVNYDGCHSLGVLRRQRERWEWLSD